jgi:hypothetical protein
MVELVNARPYSRSAGFRPDKTDLTKGSTVCQRGGISAAISLEDYFHRDGTALGDAWLCNSRQDGQNLHTSATYIS